MTTKERDAILHELTFWKRFIQTERFLKGWAGNVPTPELVEEVRQFFAERPAALVLDVGSGVVSILHGTVPVKNLIAADPLAGFYELLWDYRKHGIPQPMGVAAEELIFHDAFDVVHMSNAIDHCQDPAEAFRRLEAAVRPGGWLLIQGFEREGTHERWEGFHQWDFEILERELLFRGWDSESRSLGEASWVSARPTSQGRRWYVWARQKPA